jgi:hypothetical protein
VQHARTVRSAGRVTRRTGRRHAARLYERRHCARS